MTFDAPKEYAQADKNESDIKDIGEETIMENLKMYESCFADCIRATDLIAFFGIFTITHTKELRSIYKRNPTEATKRALDIVKMMTNQPEKYRRLLSALNDAGYAKVVQILDGTLIPVGSKHRAIIRHCAKHIYNCLNTTDILPYLYSKQIISKNDMQQIQRTERNESTGIAALELLEFLPYIYILIALALDESIVLDVLQFPMQNIYQSCDLDRAIGRRNVNAIQ